MPENWREDVVRTPTRTLVTACALSAALVVAGCGDSDERDVRADGDVLLQPAADQGPDPFTESTATTAVAPPPVTRTPGPARSGRAGLRSLSGETPGLYGGTRGTGSCDVRRQIDRLTADRAKGRAFARAAGISRASIPGYLRGLTSVVLRADTRVTDHGFRDGTVTGYQSVLQAGTAVLVDRHGVPRVRCACGNPLAPPADRHGRGGTSGRAWSGYRPDQVIVVAPTVQVITDITIIDLAHHSWIERPVGHRGHDHDHLVRPPKPAPPTRTPVPHPHDPGSGTPSASPGEPTSPPEPPTDCATSTAAANPAAPVDSPAKTPANAPGDCPTPTATASASSLKPPDEPGPATSRPEPEASPVTPDSPNGSDTREETGPETVPDTPDTPDGGGLVPDAPDDPDTPSATDSIFGSPTDVFDG
ncbi:DUF6777 domain-containing protein [Streptomyces sp. NPDC057740]|uniref:DUF6777 domain-containing protein n=1 Tax=Streptomyces sp. NPDC057740 TaxID=3346234 RepID=UPI0036A37D3D